MGMPQIPLGAEPTPWLSLHTEGAGGAQPPGVTAVPKGCLKFPSFSHLGSAEILCPWRSLPELSSSWSSTWILPSPGLCPWMAQELLRVIPELLPALLLELPETAQEPGRLGISISRQPHSQTSWLCLQFLPSGS